MKFKITNREKLAIVQFLAARPTANLEDGETRTDCWDDLGVRILAIETIDHVSTGGAVPGPDPKPWLDHTRQQPVDLRDASVRWLLKMLQGEIGGLFTDYLRPLQRRLMRAEAGEKA